MATHGKQPSAESVSSNSATILTKKEAAAYLKVSTRYLEREIRSGRLRAFKPTTKLVRFKRKDLDSFLESGSSLFLCSGTEVLS